MSTRRRFFFFFFRLEFVNICNNLVNWTYCAFISWRKKRYFIGIYEINIISRDVYIFFFFFCSFIFPIRTHRTVRFNFTFLNTAEQQAIRVFIPQCNISIIVQWYMVIELAMVMARPPAYMYACFTSFSCVSFVLKYASSPPINNGCNILFITRKKKKKTAIYYIPPYKRQHRLTSGGNQYRGPVAR